MNQFKKSALVLAMSGVALTAGTVNASSVMDVQGPVTVGAPFDATAGVDPVSVDSLLGALGPTSEVVAARILTIPLGDNQLSALTNQCAPDNPPAERSVVYSPSTSISENSTITFTVANGAVSSKPINIDDGLGGTAPAAVEPVLLGRYFIKDPLNPDIIIGEGNGVVGNFADFEVDAGGDYNELRFQMVQDLIAGDAYRIAYVYEDAVGNEQFTDPTFTAYGDVGSAVTIAASRVRDPSGIDIAQGTTSPQDVMVYVDANYGFLVDTEFSVIDVQAEFAPGDPASRLVFVENPGDTSTTVSRGRFDVTGRDAECRADLTKADFALTLGYDSQWGNTLAVDSVNLDFGGAGALGDGIPVPQATNGTYVLNTASPAVFDTADALIDPITNVGSHALSITANTDEILRVGTWSLGLVVSEANDGSFEEFRLMPADSSRTHVWNINGAQAEIPYHAQNVNGFVFFFNVVNESAKDAIILADVIVENKSWVEGDDPSTRSVVVPNVDFGSVDILARAGASTTIGQGDIKAAINARAEELEMAPIINDDDVYHVAMTVIVGAQQNSVQVAGFQKDPVGRTVVPVMLNVNNGGVQAYGDVWQQ